MAKGVAIKIDEELLRDIHIRTAEQGISTQQYITELVEKDLFPERFPQLTDDQKSRIKEAVDVINQALDNVADILCVSLEHAPDSMTMAL